jgi:UDPglucose--hexose-1-phosphate uridylyltransferase
VVIAPGRARRPGAFLGAIEDPTPAELETCPFCEGREERTPPETDAVADDPMRAPDTPGWKIRVVPNLYPAFDRQEVVIHSPEHVRTLADLDDGQLDLIGTVWKSHFVRAESEGFYVHALINEGRYAGASLAHSHSQLVWLPEPPPAVAAERAENCVLCELLADESLRIGKQDEIVATAHPAGRAPFELLIGPRDHNSIPGALNLSDSLVLLRAAIRRLRELEGPIPWNAWLHQGDHWHLEVVPRLTVFAGLELGAEIYVNVVEPERAAAALRDVR